MFQWMCVYQNGVSNLINVEDDSDYDDSINECNQYDWNEVDVFDKVIHVIDSLASHFHTFLLFPMDNTDWEDLEKC